jgi:hypothetical protein
MTKIDIINFYDPIERKSFYSLNGIFDKNNAVNLPYIIKNDNSIPENITHVGYEELPDTRSEYEAWKDSYFYNYIRPLQLKSVSVEISSNIKKVILPNNIHYISDLAFKNVNRVYFEIASINEHYFTKEGSIYDKQTNEIIYKYKENN